MQYGCYYTKAPHEGGVTAIEGSPPFSTYSFIPLQPQALVTSEGCHVVTTMDKTAR
jgi:hypothetical protein